MPSIIQSRGRKKLLVSDEKSCSPVMFHLSDLIGIIPWNATPGKACGATLGDICNTSEVRGDWPDLFFFFPFVCPFPSPTNFPFSPTVLPVLPPLHRCICRRRCHRHRIGKLLVIPLIMLLETMHVAMACFSVAIVTPPLTFISLSSYGLKGTCSPPLLRECV